MLTTREFQIGSFSAITCTLKAWRDEILAAYAEGRRAGAEERLDPRIQYDIGLDDRRPQPKTRHHDAMWARCRNVDRSPV